jgi:Leucine-rich repeat (LRR) protein
LLFRITAGPDKKAAPQKREARHSHIGRNPGSLLAVYVSTNVSILQHGNHSVKDLAPESAKPAPPHWQRRWFTFGSLRVRQHSNFETCLRLCQAFVSLCISSAPG